MPRDEGTILVKPVEGELGLRFMVESWTNPTQPHYVDLSRNEGSGECSCTDFQCRRAPAIKAGKQLFTRETTCKHCRAAHRFWLKHAIKAVIEAHQQQKRNHDEH